MENPESFERYLYNISMQHVQIAVIFICSNNWEQQMYSSDCWIPDDDFDLSEKDYYTQALSTDGMYITEIYMDVVTGQLCLSIGMKLDIDGYEATVGADIYLDQLVDLMESTYKGVQYASLVVDGVIVTDPSLDYVLSESKSINIADTSYSSTDGSTMIILNHIPSISNTTTIEGSNWQVISVYQLSGVICFFAGIIFLLLVIMLIMRI